MALRNMAAPPASRPAGSTQATGTHRAYLLDPQSPDSELQGTEYPREADTTAPRPMQTPYSSGPFTGNPLQRRIRTLTKKQGLPHCGLQQPHLRETGGSGDTLGGKTPIPRNRQTGRPPQERYLFLKGEIQDRKYTFATLYVPNSNQAQHIRRALSKLSSFTEGILMLGSDFNVPLHPLLDSSMGHSRVLQGALRNIQTSLRSLRLVDCWRATHPTDKEYTHYLAPHKRYARLDYLFMQQEILTRLQSAEIEAALWSDHSPVTMAVDSPLLQPATRTWRLQDSLLLDAGIREKVSEELNAYFDLNATGELTDPTNWEAHKSVVQGILIRLTAKKRKVSRQQIADLIDKITSLESQHKRSQLVSTHAALLEACRLLRDHIARTHYRTIQRSKAFFYQHANKGGKLLAKMLKGPQPLAQVHKL
ncbi:Hypothetical predicted protein [Pelobates cultripes]|uniref:Endonuclease/exonuclease/phosphatase domain-containing protein n=1 Tax=Pelobates cultripes TaxID=61616 RepID=A0AAD1RZK2_PELCU|nr:Hypothetical predicted protein [Pelobates cultripes]